MHWKRKRSSGRKKAAPRKHKSHRNGGFCAFRCPLAGGGSISSLAKTKRWYATNVRGIPEMGTAVLIGVRLSAFYRNSKSCVYLARFVTKFLDTNWQTADSSTAAIPFA
jgi:hypothetical protein